VELNQALENRYSCRRYLDKPVELEVIQELAALASHVPSWGNTQPWKVYAAGGQTAKDIRREITALFKAGREQEPDIYMPKTFDSPLMDRYRALGTGLFKVLGIARDDKARRRQHFLTNFDAFGAPSLIFWTIPKGESVYLALDCGANITAFCLAAYQAGLGTTVQSTLAYYPKVIKKYMDIPAEEDLLIGASLGYPDPEADVNRFRSTRLGLDETFSSKGF
jgi:nitroreductase